MNCLSILAVSFVFHWIVFQVSLVFHAIVFQFELCHWSFMELSFNLSCHWIVIYSTLLFVLIEHWESQCLLSQVSSNEAGWVQIQPSKGKKANGKWVKWPKKVVLIGQSKFGQCGAGDWAGLNVLSHDLQQELPSAKLGCWTLVSSDLGLTVVHLVLRECLLDWVIWFILVFKFTWLISRICLDKTLDCFFELKETWSWTSWSQEWAGSRSPGRRPLSFNQSNLSHFPLIHYVGFKLRWCPMLTSWCWSGWSFHGQWKSSRLLDWECLQLWGFQCKVLLFISQWLDGTLKLCSKQVCELHHQQQQLQEATA